MVGLVFQVNPPGWKKNLRWAGGGLGGPVEGCIFPLGSAGERLRVDTALVFRGGWLVPAFE